MAHCVFPDSTLTLFTLDSNTFYTGFKKNDLTVKKTLAGLYEPDKMPQELRKAKKCDFY